jgi:hypothetical protein
MRRPVHITSVCCVAIVAIFAFAVSASEDGNKRAPAADKLAVTGAEKKDATQPAAEPTKDSKAKPDAPKTGTQPAAVAERPERLSEADTVVKPGQVERPVAAANMRGTNGVQNAERPDAADRPAPDCAGGG